MGYRIHLNERREMIIADPSKKFGGATIERKKPGDTPETKGQWFVVIRIAGATRENISRAVGVFGLQEKNGDLVVRIKLDDKNTPYAVVATYTD